VQKADTKFYTPEYSEESAPDSLLVSLTDPYVRQLSETMNEILAYSKHPMEKGQPESALGNFISDLCYSVAAELYKSTDSLSIDFCVLNNGGLRSMLPEGKITRRHVYELMPFENELVVVTMPPDSVKRLLEYIAEKGGVPVSNIRLKIGDGVPEEVYIGNTAYDSNKTYKVVTSDYLANGGDVMTMFGGAVKTEPVGIKVRDAIIMYLEASGKKQILISAHTDGRISK